MDQVNERRFALSERIQRALAHELLRLGYRNDEISSLAPSVLRMSDHFHGHSQRSTPWSETALQAAYLAYFFPLNFVRLLSIFSEMRALGFPLPDKVFDFGSGPGTAHLAWLSQELSDSQTKWIHVEASPVAMQLHRRFVEQIDVKNPGEWRQDLPEDLSGAALFASYSLNEVQKWPESVWTAQCLIVVEPSTRDLGRALMQARQQMIERGFHIWAPCPHQGACPLLVHSKRDWCHDRIHFEKPSHWLDLEKALPMRNDTLTFSYLMASRKKPPLPSWARVIGDTLVEKGKTRQAVCRGEAREFLSWLHRNGEPPRIPHGARIELPSDPVVKGNEIRL